MNRFTSALILGAVSVAAATAWSQSPEAMGPPKVLVIDREYLKPGKSGTLHEKSEAAYVHASKAAKWSTHYLAMDSMSGAPRALFFFAYDSYAAWEKDNDAQDKAPAYAAAMDHAWNVDGDLLSAFDVSVWNFRSDLSLNTAVNIPTMRYMEIMSFKVKPGHEREFEELVKMYVSEYGKAVPDSHWAVYQNQYGANDGGAYIAIFPHKSLAELDKGMGDDARVMAAMGSSGVRKMAELSAASIETQQTNLFHFNPRMSYMSDEEIASDPSFWKPKPAPTAKSSAPPKQP